MIKNQHTYAHNFSANICAKSKQCTNAHTHLLCVLSLAQSRGGNHIVGACECGAVGGLGLVANLVDGGTKAKIWAHRENEKGRRYENMLELRLKKL
jgi:hypothetical protein